MPVWMFPTGGVARHADGGVKSGDTCPNCGCTQTVACANNTCCAIGSSRLVAGPCLGYAIAPSVTVSDNRPSVTVTTGIQNSRFGIRQANPSSTYYNSIGATFYFFFTPLDPLTEPGTPIAPGPNRWHAPYADDMTVSATVSSPAITPSMIAGSGSNASGIVRGVRRRYRINGDEYVWDTTEGVGVALSTSRMKRAMQASTVTSVAKTDGNYSYQLNLTPGTLGEEVEFFDYETITVTQEFFYTECSGRGQARSVWRAEYGMERQGYALLSGGFWNETRTDNNTGDVVTTDSDDNFGARDFWLSSGQRLSVTMDGQANRASGDTSLVDLCAGNTLSIPYRTHAEIGRRTEIYPNASLELFKVVDQFTNTPQGAFTLNYAPASSVIQQMVACRDCPRILIVRATIWMETDPFTGDAGYASDSGIPPEERENEDWDGEQTSPLIEPVQVVARIAQIGSGELCSVYTCEWASQEDGAVADNATFTGPNGVEYPGRVRLTGDGRGVYRLSAAIAGRGGASLEVKCSSKCPTTVTEAEQFPMPHTSDSTSPWLSPSPGFTPSYDKVQPEDGTFTANSITIGIDACKPGDPTYYCDDGPCKGCERCDDTPNALLAIVDFGGGDVVECVAYRDSENPCQYTAAFFRGDVEHELRFWYRDEPTRYEVYVIAYDGSAQTVFLADKLCATNGPPLGQFTASGYPITSVTVTDE